MNTAARTARGAVWTGALVLIGYAVVRGRELQRIEPRITLGAAPLVGRDRIDAWNWRFGWGLVLAAMILVVVVDATRRGWWRSASARAVLAASGLGAAGFAVALALTDGADGLTYGVAERREYLANLAKMPPAGEFVRTFVVRIDDYSVHVRGHPPGFSLMLKALDAIGLGGVWPVVVLTVVATGVVPVAVLVTTWRVVDQSWMRRAAPFLIVAPYLIWMISSADAVYTAVGAVGTMALALGIGRRPLAAAVGGFAGGLALGALLFGTYLAALFLIVPAIVGADSIRHRRSGAVTAVIAATAGLLVVVGGFRLAGFWWVDGVRRTNEEYWAGSAQFRPWRYFVLANLAVALIAVGPATLAGLGRLGRGRAWILVGAGLLAIAASDASGYTRAEVERIWLLFYPWIALAGGSLVAGSLVAGDRGTGRDRAAWWLAAQGASAVVLQAALFAKW